MSTGTPSRFIECGKIINTHGCHGDVKVEPWTDTPRDLINLGRVFVGDGDTKREIKILRGSVMQGRFLMLSLEGVTDMNAADSLRNTVLYADREDFHLEEGQYFLSDAIGLLVLDGREGREGIVLGKVTDISPTPPPISTPSPPPTGLRCWCPPFPFSSPR